MSIFKKIIILFFLSLIILVIYQKDNIKQNLSEKNKWIISSYLKPLKTYRNYKILEEKTKLHSLEVKKYLLLLEDKTLQTNENIVFLRNKDLKINLFNKEKDIYLYTTDQFLYGINQEPNQGKGSAYIERYGDILFILSSRGILSYYEDAKEIKNENPNKLLFEQIKTNLNFIKFNSFLMDRGISYKDIFIFNDNIFISYLDEVKPRCWNISIVKAKLNLEFLKFEKFFNDPECVNEIDDSLVYTSKTEENLKKDVFNTSQTGGRMFAFDNNYFLFSTGEFRFRNLAQEKNSIFGKIFLINYNDANDKKLISLGHRNPQGLFYDNKKNYIISTEHGPMGGDEINLINVNFNNFPKNYGWPISSYGEHYGGKDLLRNKITYDKFPLYKSHSKYGFEEPIHYFVPSVGTSQVLGIGDDKYILATMRAKSLFTFEIKQEKIKNLKQILIGERIRDIYFNQEDKTVYLFLENSSSLGILNLD